MKLDAVSSSGYEGSNSKVSIKQVHTAANDIGANVSIEPVSFKTEEKDFTVFEESKKEVNTLETNSNEFKKSIGEINSKLNKNTEAIFGIHEETNRVTIKIIDKDTKEVIKEIPPEKTLEMIAKIWEFAGLLVDEKR